MGGKTFEQAERNVLELLAVATVVILFWIGIWGVTEELMDKIQKRYGVTKLKLYLLLVGGVVSILVAFPHIIDRI